MPKNKHRNSPIEIETYGSLVRFHRNRLNLRQEDLAELLQVTQATVARWELESTFPPGVKEKTDKLILLAEDDHWFCFLKKTLSENEGICASKVILELLEIKKCSVSGNEEITMKISAMGIVSSFFKQYKMGKDGPDASKDSEMVENESKTKDGSFKLMTHGHRSKPFDCFYDSEKRIIKIRNEDDRVDIFKIELIWDVLSCLKKGFSDGFFPLGNNVEKLGKNTEIIGLGRKIYELNGKDIKNAQAASYLGPSFVHAGIFQWNQEKKGIKWRIVKNFDSINDIHNILKEHFSCEKTLP